MRHFEEYADRLFTWGSWLEHVNVSAPSDYVPNDVILVKLPHYAPELYPTKCVLVYLQKRFLSQRLHADQDAVISAACKAWNRLILELRCCNYP